MSKKKLMALLLTGVMAASTVSVPVFAEEAEGGSSDTPLVIGQTNFSEKFSGLFHEAVPDQQIAENVGEYLLEVTVQVLLFTMVSRVRHMSITERIILIQDFPT